MSPFDERIIQSAISAEYSGRLQHRPVLGNGSHTMSARIDGCGVTPTQLNAHHPFPGVRSAAHVFTA
jgi:hypothetical protein